MWPWRYSPTLDSAVEESGTVDDGDGDVGAGLDSAYPGIMSGTLRLGRLAGIPVLVHWSLLVIAGLIALNLGQVLSPDGGVSAWSVIAAGLAAGAFFASVLAHELAHALTARRHDVGTDSITLWALGGVAHLSSEPRSARAQGWIAVAGPAMSLVLGFVGIAAALGLHALGAPEEFTTVTAWLGVINGLLAVFNLLPGAPLDGGRVLAAVRWGRHGDRYRAMEEAATAGRVLGWSIAGLGVWLLLSGYNGLLIALSGAFIALNATVERAGARVRRQLGPVMVADIARFGLAHTSAHTDIDTILWQRQRMGPPRVVVVVDDASRPVALAAEDDLWDVDATRRSMTPVGEVAIPLDHIGHVTPDTTLAEALSQIQPSHPLLTVWHQDRLVGVVPADVLRNRIEQAQASRTAS
jgi:Zn-dependent protease